MPHYYLDIETTGLDENNDEIITIQYQKLSVDNGLPVGSLTILKSWEYGEEMIVKEIASLLLDNYPWNFVPVGNNLTFEFKFLASKIRKYLSKDVDVTFFVSRPHIDLKPIMILANGGRFKDCHLVLNKAANGSSVPQWYVNKEYDSIIRYIEDEVSSFTKFYHNAQNILKKELQPSTSNSTQRKFD